MSLRLLVPLVLASIICHGCGPSMPPPPLPSKDAPVLGPHGGLAAAMPDDLGFAEFVNEPAVEDRSAKGNTALVIYFLAKDAKTPLAPPSEVSFRSNQGANKFETIAIKPAPKAGDPAGSARFASDLGPYILSEIRGELSAKIDGKPVKVQITDAR